MVRFLFVRAWYYLFVVILFFMDLNREVMWKQFASALSLCNSQLNLLGLVLKEMVLFVLATIYWHVVLMNQNHSQPVLL